VHLSDARHVLRGGADTCICHAYLLCCDSAQCTACHSCRLFVRRFEELVQLIPAATMHLHVAYIPADHRVNAAACYSMSLMHTSAACCVDLCGDRDCTIQMVDHDTLLRVLLRNDAPLNVSVCVSYCQLNVPDCNMVRCSVVSSKRLSSDFILHTVRFGLSSGSIVCTLLATADDSSIEQGSVSRVLYHEQGSVVVVRGFAI
jgi:hypothetical protein